MAEGIGIASGALTLASFAFECSVSLYRTVKSVQHFPQSIKELQKELEQFHDTIATLKYHAEQDETRFKLLARPLLDCSEACKEFETLVNDCSKRSGGSKVSFRDWATLRYKGGDISSFRQKLARYRETINIAIGDANLRTNSATAAAVNELRQRLDENVADLTGHLELIQESMKESGTEDSNKEGVETTEHAYLSAEEKRTEDCLLICNNVSDHLKAMPHIYEDVTVDESGQQFILSTTGGSLTARRVTAAKDSRQVLGAMSSADLQGVLSKMSSNSSQGKSGLDQTQFSTTFVEQYGPGRKMC